MTGRVLFILKCNKMKTQLTNEQKITKTMNGFNCSRKSAINIVYMLDWMTENESGLMEMHKWYTADTGDKKTSFNVFCYGIWPECMKNYINKRKAEGRAVK